MRLFCFETRIFRQSWLVLACMNERFAGSIPSSKDTLWMARTRQGLIRAWATEFGHYTRHCPVQFEAAHISFPI